MHKQIVLFIAGAAIVAIGLILAGCHQSHPAVQNTIVKHSFSPDVDLVINAEVSRIDDDGRVVISGSTNLPDGLNLWVNVEEGKLPLGAPKSIASDENVHVHNGKFATVPLWMNVPNTRFTKSGWPANVNVSTRQIPFAAKEYKVHFESVFNGAWQNTDVLHAVGGVGGKSLKGKILKSTNADVIDSDKTVDYTLTIAFPALSPETKAISLVRQAILTVPDSGRSTGDVQAVVDTFMAYPGLKVAKGWGAKQKNASTFSVSFDFVSGDEGEQQAIWEADIATGKVKYINQNAKLFSWAD